MRARPLGQWSDDELRRLIRTKSAAGDSAGGPPTAGLDPRGALPIREPLRTDRRSANSLRRRGRRASAPPPARKSDLVVPLPRHHLRAARVLPLRGRRLPWLWPLEAG